MIIMFNVSLRRFEALLAIVDTGSFAAAADRLDISQPSVSAHVKAIERQLGGVVFHRGKGRRPVLTEFGKTVIAHAREVIAEMDHLQADLTIMRSSASQRVIFSCQRSLANFVLREPITEFAVGNPKIHLLVSIGKQEDVVDEVRSGSADVGCFLSNTDIRGLRSEVIGRQRLVIVVSADNPLAGRRKVSTAEVCKYGFVAPPQSSHFGRALSNLLADIGITRMNIAAQATEYHFLSELVIAGLGVACTPISSVANEVAAGKLAVIDLEAPPLHLDIRMVTSPTRRPSPAAQEFLTFLLKSPLLNNEMQGTPVR